MENLDLLVKDIESVEIHNTFSMDECYFKKGKIEFKLKKHMFVIGKHYVLSLYSGTAWKEIYMTESAEKMVKRIREI